MSRTQTKRINRFTVRIYPDGNILIAEPRLNFGWCFIFLCGSLFTGVWSLLAPERMQFALSVVCVISLILAGITFRAWLKPGSIYISMGHRHIRVKTQTEKRIIEAQEIERIFLSTEHEVHALRIRLNENSEIELLRLTSGAANDADELKQLIVEGIRNMSADTPD